MKFCKVWDEGGRSYRLERRSNEAGRFIQSSVSPVETNFTLIFPEGRGVLGGWSTPAMKLRDLGVSSTLKVSRRALVAKSLNEGCSKSKKPESSSFTEVVKKDHGDVREAVWLELGVKFQHREDLLKRCLVGS